jgi:transposase
MDDGVPGGTNFITSVMVKDFSHEPGLIYRIREKKGVSRVSQGKGIQNSHAATNSHPKTLVRQSQAWHSASSLFAAKKRHKIPNGNRKTYCSRPPGKKKGEIIIRKATLAFGHKKNRIIQSVHRPVSFVVYSIKKYRAIRMTTRSLQPRPPSPSTR